MPNSEVMGERFTMRPRGCARILMVTLAGWVASDAALAESAAKGGPPIIVATSPAVGTSDVDPSVAEITVTFDRDMAKGFSWTGGGLAYPPLVEGKRPFWRDERTAVLPVYLSTGSFYRVGVNSKSHRNFRSAAGVPALPSVIYFTTRGGGPAEAGKMTRPAVVSMVPANGAAGVEPQTSELRVTFSVPMGGGCSWTGGAGFPAPCPGEKPHWTEDGRTCVLPVRLEPERQYRLGLNSASCINFQSASGVPLDPVKYTFSTAAATNRVAAGASFLRTPPSVKMDFSPGKIQMPAKKYPDVSGVVIDGALDATPEKVEAVVRVLLEQASAQQVGDEARVQVLSRWAESNLVNVVRATRPLPKALVSLYRHADGAASEPLQSVTADDQGKFEFFGVPRGLYRIVAKDTRNETNAYPSAELTVEHYRTCEHVRPVIYPQTVTLAGRVTDSAGKPLANVAVSARQGHEHYTETAGDFTRSYHETTARTDADGRYELCGLVPACWWEAQGLEGGGYGGADSWYTVAVSAPGYGSAKAYVPVAPEETREAARLAGSLMAAAATPHQRARMKEGSPARQPPCRGYALSGVDFVLRKPASVSGVAVDGSGRPRIGCQIALDPTNHTDLLTYAQLNEKPQWARADETGTFRVTGVSSGTYWARVYEHNRCVNGKAPPMVTVREGEALDGLRLVDDARPCGKIVGVVTDAASGKPVKGLAVYSSHKETGATECPPLLCQCGMRGYHTDACTRWIERVILTNDLRVSTFVVEKAAPGLTELVLKAPEYAEERVRIDVASEAVVKREIKLWRAGTALIRPVIESGARVGYYASVQGNPPLVHYVAIPETGGPCVSGGSPSRQQVGCDEFAGLMPGRYTLRGDISYMPGHVTRYETAPLEIVSGQPSDVALDFSGPCQLKLKADFPPGTAVSVLLETAATPVGQTPESNPGLKASAYLREPGSVLIPDLKPGAYRLSLFRRDVPEKKGVAEKKEPDEVKTVTLEDGHASQTFSFRF